MLQHTACRVARRHARPSLPAGWLLLGGAALVAYNLISSPLAQALLYDAVALTAALLSLRRGLLAERALRPVWLLLAAALLTWLGGDVTSDVYVHVLDRALPFASLVDGLTLGGYALFLLAFVVYARRTIRRGAAAEVTEAAIVGLTFMLVAWVVVDLYPHDAGMGSLGGVATHAYPALDVLLLATLARLLWRSRARGSGLPLIAAALVLGFAADTAIVLDALSYDAGRLATSGWLAAYVLFGAAALRPGSLAGVTASREERPARLGLLGLALVVPPVTIVLHAEQEHVRLDNATFASVSIALSLLVVARLVGAYRHLEVARRSEQRARSEAEQAQQALAREHVLLLESEERFRGAFDGSAVGMAMVGRDGRLERVNQAFCDIVGYPTGDLLTMSLDELTHPDDVAGSHAGRAMLLAGDCDHVDLEKRYVRRDGAPVWVQVSIGVIRDEQGEPLHEVTQVRDISDVRRLADERERLDADRRVAQRLEAVGQLAAGIAHEINTPIQFVGDSVRFLADSYDDLSRLRTRYRELCREAPALDPETLEARLRDADEEADLAYLEERVPAAFERVFDGVERVSSIVRAMKRFAHPSADALALADLNEALRTTLTVCRNEMKYVADVALDLAELPPVACKLGDLNQVFLNLIVNAAHAVADTSTGPSDRGSITIRSRLAETGDAVVIEVADTGTGIPPDVAERIYEPFFTTKQVGRGSGQGLAIARTIVEQHRGTISFETELGRGTTFRVRLPLEPALAEAA